VQLGYAGEPQPVHAGLETPIEFHIKGEIWIYTGYDTLS
jgi:hypothetical protein